MSCINPHSPNKTVSRELQLFYRKVQFSSVTQLCLTLCEHIDCNMPGFPVHLQLPELTQTHVHCVCDAIQPSHFLSSSYHLPSFRASTFFQMSQPFASDGQIIGVSALESVQYNSVAQSCLTLCDPMNRSTPGLPVHHHLPEFTQTHVH